MGKSIIHIKIPMKDGIPELSFEIVNQTFQRIEKNLPNECCLIATPFDIGVIKGDHKIINIDCKEYSYSELVEIVEKAWKYDELNK